MGLGMSALSRRSLPPEGRGKTFPSPRTTESPVRARKGGDRGNCTSACPGHQKPLRSPPRYRKRSLSRRHLLRPHARARTCPTGTGIQFPPPTPALRLRRCNAGASCHGPWPGRKAAMVRAPLLSGNGPTHAGPSRPSFGPTFLFPTHRKTPLRARASECGNSDVR